MDAEASVESTAMALHALAVAKPPGWSRMAALASDWLWSVQQENGAWIEPGAPSPAYLTVLVLDAIALAKAERSLTFHLAVHLSETSPVTNAARRLSDGSAPDSGSGDCSGVGDPEKQVPAELKPLKLDTAEQRQAAVKAYIAEVFEQTGKRISKSAIWKKAGYKTRSDFERWERNRKNASKVSHDRFTRILTEKPLLK
jgi:hypothetical protein